MIIRCWHGANGSYLGTLSDHETVELAWTLRGPDAGQIGLPVTAIRTQRYKVRSERIGSYVTVEDDALLEPWFGRIEGVPGSSRSPSGTLQLAGPESWLDRQPVTAQQITGTAHNIIANVIEQHPVDARLVRGQSQHRGAGGYLDTAGMTLWELFDELEKERGVQVRLTGRTDATAEWAVLDPGSPLDLTGVVLREGKNAEFDFEHELEPPLTDLVGMADSVTRPGGVRSGGMRAPDGAVVGLKAAYDATLRSARGRGGLAQPQVATQAALNVAMEAKLRRSLPLPQVAQVEVKDTDLWSSLWPGRLVSTRCSSDPLGDFDRAVALVEQATFRVTAPKALNLAVVLWAVEG